MRRTRSVSDQRPSLCYLPVADMGLLERNPQYLTPKQMESLKRSIQRDGFVSPILVRPNGGRYEIISGNHRYLAALELGYEEVPTVVASLTRSQAKRLALNLNLIHGDPLAEQLAPFLAELDDDLLREIHLEDKLLKEVLDFDDTLNQRLSELDDVPGYDQQSSKNSPDCVCPVCGRRHQSKS